MVRCVGVVSLSRGVLGEAFVAHEEQIGVARLRELGLEVRFMPNARRGIEYLRDHPEARAADLVQALEDPEIDMILCAIGGDDTYRLLPHLDSLRLSDAARSKVFLGFSDTTVNHFFLHRLGMRTFYGQSFLADVCELERDMLPYTRRYFEELVRTGAIREVRPSDVWYEARTDFDARQIGVPLNRHPDRGFRLLQGSPVFSGKILGGCLDTIYEMFHGDRYEDMPRLCQQYGLFPDLADWRGRILLLETSEEKMPPEKYRKAALTLRETGLFEVISGILMGKPEDEAYAREYEEILPEVVDNPALPIVCNLNVGHALPRCILPFGVEATVDARGQVIRFADRM